MHKGRLEAFSDGVIAIIITIMVLELKVPHGDSLQDLLQLFPVFLSYILSFIYVGIYWNNHHHMMQAVQKVNGAILWANMNLLFWLSLFPFVTSWAGENHFTTLPVFLYGAVLFCAALAYTLLTKVILKHHGHDSNFAKAIGSDFKGKLSLVFYVLGLGFTFISSWLGIAFYISVAMLWLVPDRRFEKSRLD
jgi:uncharacterized membrane protein